jgi:hypothetical protein
MRNAYSRESPAYNHCWQPGSCQIIWVIMAPVPDFFAHYDRTPVILHGIALVATWRGPAAPAYG